VNGTPNSSKATYTTLVVDILTRSCTPWKSNQWLWCC